MERVYTGRLGVRDLYGYAGSRGTRGFKPRFSWRSTLPHVTWRFLARFGEDAAQSRVYRFGEDAAEAACTTVLD